MTTLYLRATHGLGGDPGRVPSRRGPSGGGGPAEGPAKIKAGGRVGAEGITLKVSLFSTVLIPACSLQLG